MDIANFLDNQNKGLLIDLRKYFEIAFEQDNNENCSVFFQNRSAKLFYNPKYINNDSIAHELLHIWLKKYKYHIGNPIYLTFQFDKNLQQIFNKGLCDHIGNCFDHFKMYPKYLEMGYAPERFVANGLDQKSTVEQIHCLDMNATDGIECYIAYLIAINADHVLQNYDEHLKLLKKKDAELFQIVNDFWNAWTVFDIKTIDPIFNSDAELVSNFTDNIRNWIGTKRINNLG